MLRKRKWVQEESGLLGNEIGVLLHGPAKPGIWKIRKWIVAEVVHICLDASGQAVWKVTLSGSLSGRAGAFLY